MVHNRIFFLIFIIATFSSSAKILLITHSFNRPDFIPIQNKTFKKFLLDDFELVVFNDASDDNISNKIEDACSQEGLRCIRIPQELHAVPYKNFPGQLPQGTSARHMIGIEYSLELIGYDFDGIVVLIDSDMFLIRPFSIEKYMGDAHIASFIRNTERSFDFFWPGLTFIRMNKIPNKKELIFDGGYINGRPLDTGGFSLLYINKYKHMLTIKPIDILYGYKLFCPYIRVPQHLSNYSPPSNANNHLPIYDRVVADFNLIANKSLCGQDQQATILSEAGFSENEKNFLLQKPDTIDFFLNKTFLHYQMASNWIGMKESYFQEKNKTFFNFIEMILNAPDIR